MCYIQILIVLPPLRVASASPPARSAAIGARSEAPD
jgi:hypothetical protein